jgi:hypothetical protein
MSDSLEEIKRELQDIKSKLEEFGEPRERGSERELAAGLRDALDRGRKSRWIETDQLGGDDRAA